MMKGQNSAHEIGSYYWYFGDSRLEQASPLLVGIYGPFYTSGGWLRIVAVPPTSFVVLMLELIYILTSLLIA